VELAAVFGLVLDEWEAWALEMMCAERADGRWAAWEVGLVVARQNGKGAILEARELAGLFLFGEKTITHSAHEFKTSLDHQGRLETLIAGSPEFSRRVASVRHANGQESINLKSGASIRFFTRTKSGGRGLGGELVVFDEAMILPQTAIGALMPTLSARSLHGNPQLIYTGSPVDQTIHEHGEHLSKIRSRALAGDDPSLAYMEWSLDRETPDAVSAADAVDPVSWAQANPGLGIRISPEWIALEQRSWHPRTFAVERLSVGDWPDPEQQQSLIPLDVWRALADPGSELLDGGWVFAFDVSPLREWSSVAVCGMRDDTSPHVEIVHRERGTGWVLERLAELVEAHKPLAVVYDDSGPAGSLVQEATKLGCETVAVNGGEYAEACGVFFDAVSQQQVRHLGTTELELAIRGAATRPLGDRWAWGRKSSSVDITPLVAVTLALWGVQSGRFRRRRPMIAAI
jgi:phage terminase large subunit-like protein